MKLRYLALGESNGDMDNVVFGLEVIVGGSWYRFFLFSSDESLTFWSFAGFEDCFSMSY